MKEKSWDAMTSPPLRLTFSSPTSSAAVSAMKAVSAASLTSGRKMMRKSSSAEAPNPEATPLAMRRMFASISAMVSFEKARAVPRITAPRPRTHPRPGPPPMGAAPGARDAEIGAARHHRPGADGELADRKPRPVVHAKDRIAGKALEQPVLDHRIAAAEALFGRLEDEIDGAVEVAGPGEMARGSQQHGRMPVMAAGMQAPILPGAAGELVCLLDRPG